MDESQFVKDLHSDGLKVYLLEESESQPEDMT